MRVEEEVLDCLTLILKDLGMFAWGRCAKYIILCKGVKFYGIRAAIFQLPAPGTLVSALDLISSSSSSSCAGDDVCCIIPEELRKNEPK